MGFNEKEIRILKTLYRVKVPYLINAIADKVGLSWATVNDYLEKLEKEDFVIRFEYGKSIKWQFNFEKYDELREDYGLEL